MPKKTSEPAMTPGMAPVSEQAPSAPFLFRILIVKWDLLSGDVIARVARETYPEAGVTLCRTGADALDELRRRPVALGLFGLTLPDIDGLDLLGLVADEHLAKRRMIITGRRDDYSRQALRTARVQGVFDTFVEDTESLAKAIWLVGEGGRYISPTFGSDVSPLSDRGAKIVKSLTFIEQQVFAILHKGASEKDVCERLRMEPRAVGAHRTSILRKLGVSTDAELHAWLVGDAGGGDGGAERIESRE